MVRPPRLVLPGIPYHVTQRGNRRELTFYRDVLARAADRAGAESCHYCASLLKARISERLRPPVTVPVY
jgi:hypothetical protein